MATNITAHGDTLKIDKAFVSGKDRITVNGQVAFEGKLCRGTAQVFDSGSRKYTIESRIVSWMTGAQVFHLQVQENSQEVHTGIYDLAGKPLQNESQAKAGGAVQACGMVGMAVGLITMMFLNLTTGVVPGGAIGGAIGGGGGAAIGYGIGTLLFGNKPALTNLDPVVDSNTLPPKEDGNPYLPPNASKR